VPTGSESLAFRPFLAVARKVVPWAIDHPFVARPAVWNSLTAFWFVATVAALLLGVTATAFFLVLAVALAFLTAGMWGWVRLTASSDQPIIFISQFAPATPGAGEAALNHLNAVQQRFVAGTLGPHATLRRLPVSVTKDQAKRLLDVTSARAVVFGRVKAIADVGSWDAEMLLRWPGDTQPTTAHITGDLEVEVHTNRRKRPPDRHETQADYQAPLAALIAERFESAHVDVIEGTLLTLVAACLSRGEGSHAAAGECLQAAAPYRDAVSTHTRAVQEITRVVTGELPSAERVLQELERAGLADANHEDLWSFLVGVAFLGGIDGSVPVEDRLKFARNAVEAAPGDATARYNLGEAYMAADRPEDALLEFDLAASDPDYTERYYLQLNRGMLNYNAGRFEAARDQYQAAADLQRSAEVHLFLGDAHRQLGDHDAARANYLLALHEQPTLVDAHRGYWYVLQPGQVPEDNAPGFDRGYSVINRLPRWLGTHWRHRVFAWWLRRHYRRHPEDTRIHFMLGAHALLAGDLETAEERLQFAPRRLRWRRLRGSIPPGHRARATGTH